MPLILFESFLILYCSVTLYIRASLINALVNINCQGKGILNIH